MKRLSYGMPVQDRKGITAVLLAGGRGKRLGQDKALLNIGGEPLIRRVAGRLQYLCQSIVIVGGDLPGRRSALEGLERFTPLTFIPDLFPGKGSLGGIYSGLKTSDSSYALAVACDMPFLNLDLLKYMIDQAEGYDAVVPRIREFFEPLHAIYSRRCLDSMARLIEHDNLKIFDLFPETTVRYIHQLEVERFDPHHLSLFDINTAEDLKLAKDLVKQEQLEAK